MWNEAQNQAGVDASSTLRRAENVFYPPTIRASGPSSSKAESAPNDPDLSKDASTSALPSSTIPPKEVDHVGAAEKEKDTVKEVVLSQPSCQPHPRNLSSRKESPRAKSWY